MYRLYGMYLTVLSAHKVAEEVARRNGDPASTVFSPARGRAQIHAAGVAGSNWATARYTEP